MFRRAELHIATWLSRLERSGLDRRRKSLQWNLIARSRLLPPATLLSAALSSLRKGGVVAINAIHLDRMPEFDYDRLLWGERQIRSVANMTRDDARDFLKLAAEIRLRPQVTTFTLDQANEALAAVKNDAIDGAAVIVP